MDIDDAIAIALLIIRWRQIEAAVDPGCDQNRKMTVSHGIKRSVNA